MTSTATQSPFWKRKRWIAVAVLWLVLAYLISIGPVAYCVECGWLSEDSGAIEGLYWPAVWAADCLEASDLMTRYVRWCYDAGASL